MINCSAVFRCALRQGRFSQLAFLGFFLMLASSLEADAVYLKDGQVLIGTIVEQSRVNLVLRLTSGQIRPLEKQYIARIVYGNPNEQQAARDEAIRKEQERLRQLQQQYLEEQRRKEEEQRLAAAELERKRLQQEQERRSEPPKKIEENKTPASAELQPRDRMLRSMVFPGWGQIASKRSLAGGLFAGSMTLLAFQTISSYSSFRTAGLDDRHSGRILQAHGGLTSNLGSLGTGFYLMNQGIDANRKAASRFSSASVLLLIVWAWNAGDAYLFPGPIKQAGTADFMIWTTARPAFHGITESAESRSIHLGTRFHF